MNKKLIIMIACISLVTCIAVGSTLAFLVTKTEALQNIFSPSHVSVEVSGTTATNIGETNAYFRMTAVVTVQSTTDPNVYYGTPFVWGTDYTGSYSNVGDWVLNEDGYFYYPTAVAAGNSVIVPTLNVEIINADFAVPAGYQVVVQYLVTAIQAWPNSAIENAWGGSVSNGVYTPSNPQTLS
ncbi:MAG: hypothetical protein IJY50_08460 [Clostridia bacterium]|nr:hypothetical protein [Clostridia bacterium]